MFRGAGFVSQFRFSCRSRRRIQWLNMRPRSKWLLVTSLRAASYMDSEASPELTRDRRGVRYAASEYSMVRKKRRIRPARSSAVPNVVTSGYAAYIRNSLVHNSTPYVSQTGSSRRIERIRMYVGIEGRGSRCAVRRLRSTLSFDKSPVFKQSCFRRRINVLLQVFPRKV